MRRKLVLPFVLPFLALGVATVTVALTLALALVQPWVGVTLAPGPTPGGGVLVAGVAAEGPAARVGLRSGEILTAIGGVAVEPGDVLVPPDAGRAAQERFHARQGALSQALQGGALLRLTRADGSGIAIQPQPRRPLRDLPVAFWGQLAAGTCAFLFGAWVLSLRRDDPAGTQLSLSGVGLMLASHAAAVGSSREIALPEAASRVLASVHHLGAMLFCAALLGLFLCHPMRLVRGGWQWLPVAGLLPLWLAELTEPTWRWPIPLALAVLLVLVLAQLRCSRGDPRARAALCWIGLSVVLSAGGFMVTMIVPPIFGRGQALSQGMAVVFLLPIYGGLALAVARHRLFEVGDWAFRLLFHMGAVLLLVVLDGVLIAVVALERAPAFGVALLLTGLLYLPLRAAIARRVFALRRSPTEPLLRALGRVTLPPQPEERLARWKQVLSAEFDPLEITDLDFDPGQVRISEDGAALDLPGLDGLPPLRLSWARAGRGLFDRSDLDHAAQLTALLGALAEARRAHDTGAAEERARIARDMHDNIGTQLAGALHAASADRKDLLIRGVLGDLRAILSGAERPSQDPAEMLADLRAELADHAAGCGVGLEWRLALDPGLSLPRPEAHALRAVLREAVGNALRHSGARRIGVEIAVERGRILLSVDDDGRGLDGAAGALREGQGLSNMQARIAALGGALRIKGEPGEGVSILGMIPLAEAAR